MSRFQKKILLWLFILSIACPIGILLPEYFRSGEAWGEWDVKTIKERTGIEPKGMAKDAAIWKAPVPDYQTGSNTSLVRRSGDYILSAVLGVTLTLLLTFFLIKLTGRNEKTP